MFFEAQPAVRGRVDVAHAGVVIPGLRHDDVFAGGTGEPGGPPAEGAVAENEVGAARKKEHFGGFIPSAGAADKLPVVVLDFVMEVLRYRRGVVREEENSQAWGVGLVVGDAATVIVVIAGADAFSDVVVGDVVAPADVDAYGGCFADAFEPVAPGFRWWMA